MSTQTKERARYVPRIKNKKWSTIVCDGPGNGGIHSQRQFKKLIAMLENAAHTWRNPRLFHLILTGATRPIYAQLMNKFCRRLRDAGVLCEYIAATELDSEKGLHQHVMLVMSTARKPSQYIVAADEHGKVDASMLRQVVRELQAECNTLACRVQRPASRATSFIEMNQTNGDFLNEAVEWSSYIVKARSKLPASEGRCYSASRPDRRHARAKRTAQQVDSLMHRLLATTPRTLKTAAATEEDVLNKQRYIGCEITS